MAKDLIAGKLKAMRFSNRDNRMSVRGYIHPLICPEKEVLGLVHVLGQPSFGPWPTER